MPFVLLYLVVEIVALVALVSWIGIGWTLLVLLAGSVLGLWLARREGLRALRALAEAARERRVAHVEVTDGLLIAIGGLLLIVPGLVTDVAGLLLLLRPTRALVRRRMVRDAERHVPLLRTARIRADGTVIDGEVVTPDPGAPLGDRPALPRVVRGDAYVVEGEVVDGQVVDAEIVDEGPGGSRPLAS
jgi:UPF0716 protein FxsA